MVIIYNPKDGAPITSFIFEKEAVSPHYPDGYELKNGKVSRGMVQYKENVAEALLETYQFLKKLTPNEAKKILDKPVDSKYKCDFPGCDFSTVAKIALSGHKRTHAKEEAKLNEPAVDPKEIPISESKKSKVVQNERNVDNLPNGQDRDGVEWYGDGAKVERFGGIRKPGKGHFIG